MPGSPNNAEIMEYFFDPGQTVWIIQGCGESSIVMEATVARVIGVVTSSTIPAPYTISYNVNLLSSSATSTLTIAASDIFATLSEAVDEYEVRLAA